METTFAVNPEPNWLLTPFCLHILRQTISLPIVTGIIALCFVKWNQSVYVCKNFGKCESERYFVKKVENGLVEVHHPKVCAKMHLRESG